MRPLARLFWLLTMGSAAASAACGSRTALLNGQPESQGNTSDAGASVGTGGGTGLQAGPSGGHIKTVFLIVMGNVAWYPGSNGEPYILGNAVAPYINGTLLTMPQTSYCDHYFDNPTQAQAPEANYIWLEAGSNLGLTDDGDPSPTHILSTAHHLAAYMTNAGIAWKEYAEGIDGATCPLVSRGDYGADHVPFLFFSDIVGSPPDAQSGNCIEHVRPYAELQRALESDSVAAYNFITPNLCDDMDGNCGGNAVIFGDTWLRLQIPNIMTSRAYQDGGAIFITWEGNSSESPIGMIVVSPLAKGSGFKSTNIYYHSSTLRTIQEIFGLLPFLGDAANQRDLSDLFTAFP